jgi:hypothetical protein
MTRPETVRRIKSYSAATGYVYQYYFYEVEKKIVDGVPGTEYVYMVSADRKRAFPLRIFIRENAKHAWAQKQGRPLSGTEEYAAAKMRLFEALDQIPDIERELPAFMVDEPKLEELLAQLDL